MARIPGLTWAPLPENATAQPIRPTQWILHTAVDAPGPTSVPRYFGRSDITLESHTWLPRSGSHVQMMDTERRADANYLANRRPDGTGAISTETEDEGNPEGVPWNTYQINELIRTGATLAKLHKIPPRFCRNPSDPGIGWHSMWGAPSAWTPVVGKTCPGQTRINQLKTIVLPGINARLGKIPAPAPAHIKRGFTVPDYSLWKIEGKPEVWAVADDTQSKRRVLDPATLEIELYFLGLKSPSQIPAAPAGSALARWVAGIPVAK